MCRHTHLPLSYSPNSVFIRVFNWMWISGDWKAFKLTCFALLLNLNLVYWHRQACANYGRHWCNTSIWGSSSHSRQLSGAEQSKIAESENISDFELSTLTISKPSQVGMTSRNRGSTECEGIMNLRAVRQQAVEPSTQHHPTHLADTDTPFGRIGPGAGVVTWKHGYLPLKIAW